MLTDPTVFDEGHHPRHLLHRDREMNTLTSALGRGDSVLLSGPTGVGKTTLTRAALREYERERGAAWAHVETASTTEAQILHRALAAHPATDEQPDNTARFDLRLALRDAVGPDHPLILILDEGDDLARGEVLDWLLELDGVQVVVVCHDQERWLSAADAGVRDRLSRPPTLSRFAPGELADILGARADRGLAEDAVDRDTLERIADDVAGIARVGIQSLRSAAELAVERGHDAILEPDVDDAYERARHRIRQASLGSLSIHGRVCYAIVHAAGADGVSAGDLHDHYDVIAERVYDGRASQPVSKRYRRDVLAKAEDYDLIEFAGPQQHRRYRPVDLEVEPDVALPANRARE